MAQLWCDNRSGEHLHYNSDNCGGQFAKLGGGRGYFPVRERDKNVGLQQCHNAGPLSETCCRHRYSLGCNDNNFLENYSRPTCI